MRSLLVLNGTIVTADYVKKGNIAVSGGKIVATGDFNLAEYRDSEKIDATGKLLLPGGVDPHVHLALPTPTGPSSDDFVTGSKAAIAGGTTSLIDFVTPVRGQSLTKALDARKKEAKNSLLDYKFHMGISEWNPGIASAIGKVMTEDGIVSFKTYLAYRKSIGISEDELEQVMKTVAPRDGIVLVHCEDGEMISKLQQDFLSAGKTGPEFHALSRPEETEARAVEKVIELSAKTDCRTYIVHTSTGKAAEIIRQAKASGVRVFAETCPQYLLLDESVYFSEDKMRSLPYIISPPIRKKENLEAVWKGLSSGTFDTVATDHCPFNLQGQKDCGLHDFTKIPNGAGGIEHRLSLLYTYGVLTGRITLGQFVKLTSTRPAELFGMGTYKGKLESGYDADIVIWNPEWKDKISIANHHQNCDSEIFEGFQIQGKAETVIVKGEVVFSEDGFRTETLKGRFISA
jgi:dihydropyrimidinase